MPDGGQTQVYKDGIAWRIGSEREIRWIRDGTGVGRQITAAIPPVFADYATLVHPGESGVPRDVCHERHQDLALVELLRRHALRPRWWLGYLDTGASDIVFWDAAKVMLYTGWRYVLIEAGAEQAATWRPAPGGQRNWKSRFFCRIVFSAGRRARSSSAKMPRPLATLRTSTRASDLTAAAMGALRLAAGGTSTGAWNPGTKSSLAAWIAGGSRRQLARVVHPVT